MKSIDRMKKLEITGYKLANPSLIYFGSFLWMSVLIGLKCIILFSDIWDDVNNISPIVWTALALNIWTFFWQTIDVVYFDFSNWAIISLHWVSQLSNIALSATILSLSAAVSDKNNTRLLLALVLVVGESLFTASQFSVTLEYLHKASQKDSAIQVMPQSRNRLSVKNNL